MNELSLSDQSIIKETDKLLQMGRQTIEQGIKVGKLYKEKKSHPNHGEWMPWVEVNLPVAINWTQKIIKLADNEDLVNASSNTHLTGITQALKFIREEEAKDRPPKQERKVQVKEKAPEDLYINSLLDQIQQLMKELENCKRDALQSINNAPPLWMRIGNQVGCKETKAKYLIKVAKKELNIVGIISHYDDHEAINQRIYDHIVGSLG